MNVFFPGKGGKNRRRGKNENESEKRELVFKEDGQGEKTFKFVTISLFRVWKEGFVFTVDIFIRRIRSGDQDVGERTTGCYVF